MTILCITAATSIFSLGLLVGCDLCFNLTPDIAGAMTVPSNRRRSAEDIMG
ncbi:hypothetical protein [Azospirillum sp. Sh1]|uniref:hypothetical protein n=1 Tax=Azospirillum sp. Sh1 TaxID=2607285 RepID=UPI00165E8055|nr:hypothetical protein [Azospirillum sp. Sh1]